MTDRETFRTLISQRQHEAEEALVHGDVGPRLQMWSHNDPVTLFAALRPSKSGWGELEPTFDSVASRVSGGHDVAHELITFDVSGDLAWTVGFSRFTVSIDGGPLTRSPLRVTHPVPARRWRMERGPRTQRLPACRQLYLGPLFRACLEKIEIGAISSATCG
jgi:ketosteroid isomerase-like protein